MTLGSQLTLYLWGLKSPQATLFRLSILNPGTDLDSVFPDTETLTSFSSLATFLFYSLPVVDWLPRPPVSLNYYHPLFTLLFGFFHLKQGFVWWMWTVHNYSPLRNHSTQSIQASSNLSLHRVLFFFFKKKKKDIWSRNTADTVRHQTSAFKRLKIGKAFTETQMTLSWIFNAGHVW